MTYQLQTARRLAGPWINSGQPMDAKPSVKQMAVLNLEHWQSGRIFRCVPVQPVVVIDVRVSVGMGVVA